MRQLSRIGRLPVAAGIAATVAFWAVPPGAKAQQPSDMKANQMTDIRIRIGDQELLATLDNSVAGRDFLSLLPMSLTLEDYANTEKVSDLPRRLTTDGAPEGYEPSEGDITYYAPWGNLAIFYRDFGYARGLVRLGRINGPLDPLTTKETSSVRIERLE